MVNMIGYTPDIQMYRKTVLIFQNLYSILLGVTYYPHSHITQGVYQLITLGKLRN